MYFLGVVPLLVREALNVEEMFDIGVKKALDIKLVKQGDTIIITAGGPVGTAGTTNLLKVQTVTTI
ncbi:MAG: pyruvate kinase [Clostridium sp.]|jgi:pyruvate kinase